MRHVQKRFLSISVLLGLLSACSITEPVRGKVDGTDEYFLGTATGYLNDGDVAITSNKGAKCTGKYVIVTRREGEGTFLCDDGRTGPFHFVTTGTSGTGTGILGDKNFTFTFGN